MGGDQRLQQAEIVVYGSLFGVLNLGQSNVRCRSIRKEQES